MADEDTNWEYKPGRGGEKHVRTGQPVSWTASEYIDHEQGLGWFTLLTLATAALAVVVYFLTKDYFATGVIVVVGLIVGVFARRKPRELKYELSADGLRIENRLYPLRIFKSYTIIQEGPIGNLEFMPLKRFMPPVSAYFELSDQKRIVAVLQNYLPYEERGLDNVERLSRRLRF
ncbi:MAG TPA: hypothetical protein VG964_03230 [Candidatus Saccharimonadales bacterium]|nr:hypothetical protein [Candidatus Saccharimonadales bacterium]